MKVIDFKTRMQIWFEPLLSLQAFYGLTQEDQHAYLLKNSNRHSWNTLKEMVLIYYEEQCFSCGTYQEPSVDHILPQSKYPLQRLSFKNLQVLCKKCNSAKSDRPNETLKQFHPKTRYYK